MSIGTGLVCCRNQVQLSYVSGAGLGIRYSLLINWVNCRNQAQLSYISRAGLACCRNHCTVICPSVMNQGRATFPVSVGLG